MGLNPGAVKAMAELGIDISSHASQHVDSLLEHSFSHVITVCDNARESCPVFPAEAEMLHWSFDDPATATGSDEERMAVFRRVRDEIRTAILDWLATGRG